MTSEAAYRPVMKASESLFKRSLPCPVTLDFSEAPQGRYGNRVRRCPVSDLKQGATGELVVQYDGRRRPLATRTELFHETRTRAWESWQHLTPAPVDTFHPEIRDLQEQYIGRVRAERMAEPQQPTG
ncbi:MAG: hypothetical protein JSS02_33870 [Planctomycetes bacterium]|nr:hypothetical protein [Planctomycetota bacterium]